MSRWKSRQTQEATFLVMKETGQALLARDNSQRARQAYATNLQRFIYSIYPDSLDLVASAERIVSELGGTDLEVDGGKAISFASPSLRMEICEEAAAVAL